MNQPKLDNSVAEINTNLEAMNNILNGTEERINDLDDRIMEITQLEQQTERQKKKKTIYEIYGIIQHMSTDA